MFTPLVCLHSAGLLLIGILCLAMSAAPPVSVSVRIVAGPWGGQEYTIAHGTLTVFQIPSVRASTSIPQQVFQTQLPADAANRRFNALDPNTYQGIPNELLEGGSVLVIAVQQGSAKQSVSYQNGQYTKLDPTTSFLLTYINQHVPAKLAIDAKWLRPVAGFKK